MPGIRERLVPNPKSRLREQFHEVARFKHLSERTEEAYWQWGKRYLVFHKEKAGFWRHPREMGGPEVREFLSHLAVERHVAASTQNQALHALVFLHREVVGNELGGLGEFDRAQRPATLPTVLSQEEVFRVLKAADGKYALVLELLYGAGLRLLECLRLRVKDVDLSRGQIVVRDGKGRVKGFASRDFCVRCASCSMSMFFSLNLTRGFT